MRTLDAAADDMFDTDISQNNTTEHKPFPFVEMLAEV